MHRKSQNAINNNIATHSQYDSLEKDNDIIDSLDDTYLPVPSLPLYQSAILVAMVAVLCFAVTQNGGFVFDDTSAIMENKDIRTENSVWDVFKNDFWGTAMMSELSHKSYRPLTVLTYRWNYWLAGGLEPQWFHRVNIALHALNSVLLLRVFSLLFGGIPVKRGEHLAPKISLVCSLIFAAHPVHTESVSIL